MRFARRVTPLSGDAGLWGLIRARLPSASFGTGERERSGVGTGILFEEPNPTGSRPSDLIGLYRKWQRTKRPQPGELGIGIQQLKRHARSAVAVVMVASSEQANAWRPGREEAVKAMGLVRGTDQEERSQPAKKSSREEGGGDRGSTAARPTLTLSLIHI